jgi:hypothetical protein
MTEEWAQMAGEIDLAVGLNQLAANLAKQGIRVEIRESCHYEGGRYIRVCEGAADFILEQISGEYLARADAASIGPMYQVSSRLSRALAALDIRHCFEVYSGKSQQVIHYLHHRWPQANPA